MKIRQSKGLTFDDVLLIRRHQVAFGPVAEAFTPANIASAY